VRGVAALKGLWQSLGDAALLEWSGVQDTGSECTSDRQSHTPRLVFFYLHVEEQTKLLVASAHCCNGVAARWSSSLCVSTIVYCLT